MLILRCHIEQLADWYPRLFLELYIVACVAVLQDYSESPAKIDVECENVESSKIGEAQRFVVELAWNAQTASKAGRLRSTVQRKPLVEGAAAALGLVLAHRVADLGELDVTEYGDRADYRSVKESSVLEISGTESLPELERRHREKVTQALANPFGWDACVVVCAFSEKGHRIRLSKHLAREA